MITLQFLSELISNSALNSIIDLDCAFIFPGVGSPVDKLVQILLWRDIKYILIWPVRMTQFFNFVIKPIESRVRRDAAAALECESRSKQDGSIISRSLPFLPCIKLQRTLGANEAQYVTGNLFTSLLGWLNMLEFN